MGVTDWGSLSAKTGLKFTGDGKVGEIEDILKVSRKTTGDLV